MSKAPQAVKEKVQDGNEAVTNLGFGNRIGSELLCLLTSLLA
jgi:hypothetical protein